MNDIANPAYYPQPQKEPPKRKNGAAVTSLIMGILSLVFACCGGSMIFGIIGIITAIVSKSKSTTGKMGGMAIAGLIMSIAGVAAGIAGIVFLIIAIAGETSFGMLSRIYDIIEEFFRYGL